MARQFIAKKLKGHPAMAAEVRIYTDDTIELVSYETLVARAWKQDDGLYILMPFGQYWDHERVYTPTSARHLSLFFAEYFEDITYPAFKKYAIEDNKRDIHPNGTEPIVHLKKGVNAKYGG